MSCKDCIHNCVCSLWRREEGQDAKFYAETEDGKCECFADESRFMELPCKCGDTVWYLNCINEVCEAVVTVIEINLFTNPQTWISLKYQSVMFGEHTYKSRIDMALGKTVFLTKEEAEAEIERRKHEHH